MSKKTLNKNLHKAKNAKKDEFYTQLPDIERELSHYTRHFKGKVVLCNCDDPRVSNFFHYFSYNFEKLGLKRLITTCYKNQDMDLFSQHKTEKAIYLEYEGDKNENKSQTNHVLGDVCFSLFVIKFCCTVCTDNHDTSFEIGRAHV